MQRQLGSYAFVLVGELVLDRDASDRIIQYSHALGTIRPNAFGNGPFCNFTVPGAPAVAGVYAIDVQEETVYIGECVNLSARFGTMGYGHIGKRNCHHDGQATNCKVNMRVLQAAEGNRTIQVWFHATDRRNEIEVELLEQLQPPWNSRSALRRQRHGEASITRDGSLALRDFETAILAMLREAGQRRLTAIRIRASDLHPRIGGYPGRNHRMPLCCIALRHAMLAGDRVIDSPPSGKGASLTIEYRLPRADMRDR